MTSYALIQAAYIDLYRVLRRYIWSLYTVEDIADLEASCAQICIDMNLLRAKFSRVRSDVFEVAQEDKDLRIALDSFDKLIHENDQTYVKLVSFKEV